MYQRKKWMILAQGQAKVACGSYSCKKFVIIMDEMSDGKKYGLMFLFIFITAFIIIATLIFPFWNLIREDVYEEVEIMGKWSTWYGTMCNVDTSDNIPKTIDNCDRDVGDVVTAKYGKDMAYAEIVNP